MINLLTMRRESNNKSFKNWIEEIWDEIEIQFFGITGAIFFFILLYIIFHPLWMRPLIEFFHKIN